MPFRTQPTKPLSALRIALAGMLSLAVVMGLGRFAFTPLMPMMLHEARINLQEASWLASANYFGYLLGAILCMLQPIVWKRYQLRPLSSAQMVRSALIAIACLTALMANDSSVSWTYLRFITGSVTAIGFVYTSSWCLAHLAQRNASTTGGIIYAGPGVGIAVSGLFASVMVVYDYHAAQGWCAFGLLAAIVTVIVWRVFHDDESSPEITHQPIHITLTGGTNSEKIALTAAYGLAGFGYIITATFLPVIARAALPGSIWPDLFWPILGVGVACGAILSSRIAAHIDQRQLLIVCYVMQALGVVLSNWMPNLLGFAIGSILVGLPFTAITFFVMQLGRNLHPQSAASMIGLLTASFGACQIAGPPVAAYLLSQTLDQQQGFSWALDLAAISLLVGALIYMGMIKTHPHHTKQPSKEA